jgi:hypothetical protein
LKAADNGSVESAQPTAEAVMTAPSIEISEERGIRYLPSARTGSRARCASRGRGRSSSSTRAT